jgi:phosphatidylglycerophosphate synthase
LRRLADALTASRIAMAVAIAYLGLSQTQEQSVQAVIWLTFAAWNTDWLDGQIARWARDASSSWVGRRDLEIDLLLVTALGAVLIKWGLILPVILAFISVGGWVLWQAFGSKDLPRVLAKGIWLNHEAQPRHILLLQFATGIIYASMILVAWQTEVSLGIILLVWLAVSNLLLPRQMYRRISNFFRAIARALSKRGDRGDSQETE